MGKQLAHIAFIPDGNRRWAEANGLTSFEGHYRGYELAKQALRWCFQRGVNEVSFWGFSTENWKRSKDEVDYLMKLMIRLLKNDIKEFKKEGARLRVVGRRDDLSQELQKAIDAAEEATVDCEKGTFYLCFNYGGRAEIHEGVKRCLREGLDPEALTEEEFAAKLWSADMSDIDLIIRTSGEQRLSGFMPWRGSYSELYFSYLHWPDFSEGELDTAITWYKERERRFGGDSVLHVPDSVVSRQPSE